jgi:hypothetical protein
MGSYRLFTTPGGTKTLWGEYRPRDTVKDESTIVEMVWPPKNSLYRNSALLMLLPSFCRRPTLSLYLLPHGGRGQAGALSPADEWRLGDLMTISYSRFKFPTCGLHLRPPLKLVKESHAVLNLTCTNFSQGAVGREGFKRSSIRSSAVCSGHGKSKLSTRSHNYSPGCSHP